MTEETNQPRIIKANKKYRTILLSSYLFFLCVGFLFFYFIFPVLLRNFKTLESISYYNVAKIVMISFFIFFIAPASYLILIGRKIKRFAQFPFPGMKVMRDTKVISGKQAIARGNMLIYFGFFACLISIISSIHVYGSIQKILSSDLLRQLPLF